METRSLICLLLSVSGGLGASRDQLDGYNSHEHIVQLTKFVRDYLARDVQETRRFAKESNKETEKIAKDIIKHVKDLNNESTDRFEKTLNKLKKEIEDNMNKIVTREKESHIALEERSSANEKEISDKSFKNFNNLISGLNARLSQHERMLNTHVAVCAEKYKSIGYGKVTYQELLTESVRIGGVRKRGEVLEPSQGEFIVPVGAEGTYQVSFSAIIDTHKDFDNRLFPATFVFAKKRVGTSSFGKLSETTLTTTVGHPGGDKAPVSRSILMDLKAGEKVAVFQERRGAESSYRLTFCANLVRPSAPASWHKLSDPLPIELNTDETYAEPKPQKLTIEELSNDLKDPEVSMPNPKSALRFPKTQLFQRAADLEAAKFVAPQRGNANEIQEHLHDNSEVGEEEDLGSGASKTGAEEDDVKDEADAEVEPEPEGSE